METVIIRNRKFLSWQEFNHYFGNRWPTLDQAIEGLEKNKGCFSFADGGVNVTEEGLKVLRYDKKD